MTVKLFDSELKVMEVLWRDGDRTAKEIAVILREETGWNTNTTYTVIKRLSERGVVKLENARVTALVSREEVQRSESRAFVERTFSGSLPQFIAAFAGGKRLTRREAAELREMIDQYEEE